MLESSSEMNFKITDIEGDNIRFILENTDVVLGNELRNLMVSKIPSLAIDWVEIIINTTSLPDELLVQRFTNIKLKCDDVIGDFLYSKEECPCQTYCAECSIEFSLHVKCIEEGKIVTAADLISSNDKVVVNIEKSVDWGNKNTLNYKQITIANMRIPQELKLRAYATKGYGSDHPKWNPTHHVSCYVSGNGNKHFRKLEEDIYLWFNGQPKLMMPRKFIFEVQGNGSLKPESIVAFGIKALISKLLKLKMECTTETDSEKKLEMQISSKTETETEKTKQTEKEENI